MAGRWPFIAEKIASRLALVQPHIHRKMALLPPFRLLALPNATVDAPICADPSKWDEIPPESYWGHADLNFVMKSHFTVPHGWDASSIALHLPLGVMGDIFNHPEALVHVDREPIGSADRYHHTIPLDATLADGRRHVLSLHGWTGLAGWPPDPNSKAKPFMGRPALVELDERLQKFCDLSHATLDAARMLDPDSVEHIGLLKALDDAFKTLDTRDPMGDAMYASVSAAQNVLENGIAQAGAPLDHTLHGIGHAHMDIAYLWPISQIRLKNARTYTNVLRLMDDDPEFRFSHSQPQLYAMVENDYPAIFAKIRDRVVEGRWEVMGGTWVEPDLNIPGPEALVQQFVLGRRYFKDRFGDVETPVLWLPDTFGFPAQIPQLMRHAGLKWFVTNKLNWNQRNKVPWSTHLWEALDGTKVLAHILTTPREVQYLPFPTNYKSDLSAAEVRGTVADKSIPAMIADLPICYGYGDGGGGPTRELLAKAHAFSDMPGMPRFKMSTVRQAFERIEAASDDLNVWHGEHYMEGHRGVLTSQGWIKRANRSAERALHEAEALSAMADLQSDLDEAWQLLCLNQFHDIVTGTSVPQVFEDARRDFARIASLTEKVAAQAAEALSQNADAIANTSPLSGPRVASLDTGELVYFEELKAYSVTPVSEASQPRAPVSVTASDDGVVLENADLLVRLDRGGRLTRVFNKALQTDILTPGRPANELQAFEDRPICWDAWDIDPSFEDRMEVVSGKTTFDVIESGPLRASVRVTTKWRSSTITQTVRLATNSQRLDFETTVDWHERHTLLKAAFPTCLTCPSAEFDIQWGSVTRSTSRESPFDAARFEVPAQKWARLVDNICSVAVLNDCKYGYDVLHDTIRITLIKSSTSPDPNADQGYHFFTYCLHTMPSTDRSVLDHEAYALNTPVRHLTTKSGIQSHPFEFVKSRARNVIVETVKPALTAGHTILRIFEAHGQTTRATLEFGHHLSSAEVVMFDETATSALETQGKHVEVKIGAYEILSLRVAFRPSVSSPSGSP